MNPEDNFEEQNVEAVEEKFNALTSVTPLSKYLAMILFIAMPFIGGYFGYKFSPEKVIEVEKIIEAPIVVDVGESALDSSDDVSDNEDYESSQEEFNLLSIKVGDIISGMEVVSIEPYRDYYCLDERCLEKEPSPISEDNLKIKFVGGTVLRGELSMPTGDPEIDGGMGPEYSMHNVEQRGFNDRIGISRFGIINTEVVDEADVKNGDRVEITISSYELVSYPAGVWDTAEISSIVARKQKEFGDNFKSLGRDGAYTDYSIIDGHITGSWGIIYGPNSHGGSSFNFVPNEASRSKLPPDNFGRFSISKDGGKAKNLFGLEIDQLENEGEACSLSGGEATIVISEYSVLEAEMGATDWAKVVEVIDYSPYTEKECWD